MSPSQYTQTYIFILFITRIRLLLTQPSCDIAYQCVGTEWILSSGQSIYGNGYKSLLGTNTSITSSYNDVFVGCGGAYSCTQISFILSQYYVHCGGSHSCANIAGASYIDTSNNVACDGLNSCSNSNIRSNTAVYCTGDQSCNYANISAPAVSAEAAYSLYGSTIDSNNIAGGQLTVYLRGYQSGFGGTIICRAGDTCDIYCYFNGCQMLYLLCEDDINCNIILNSNDPTITSLPIQKRSGFDHKFYDRKYMHFDSNALCNNSTNNFIYDNDQQQQVSINMNVENGGPVCCRGSYSCRDAGTIQITAETPDIIVCSGLRSCDRSTTNITTTGPTFCEGYWSCYETTITGSDNVYCLGQRACEQSTITGSKNVYCSGSFSCLGGQGAQMESTGSDINIYLLGYRAGAGMNINCNIGDECTITCGGYQSCGDTILFCNNNCLVYCNDDTGCPTADNYTLIQLRSLTVNQSQSPTTNPSRSPTTNPNKPPTTNTSKSPTTNTSKSPTMSDVNDSNVFSFVYNVFMVLLCYIWGM